MDGRSLKKCFIQLFLSKLSRDSDSGGYGVTLFILGDAENFKQANPLVTPVHIKPEWYFLFVYAILRSIPNKLGGAVALVFSILVLLFFTRLTSK